MTKQCIADQKRTIVIRHLLFEIEIGAIIIPLENVANEETVEHVTEDVGVGEKSDCGHNISGEVVYSHSLEPRRCTDALSKENITVPENLRRLQRNFNQSLQKFKEAEPCSRHSFSKLNSCKDLIALVGYLNSKILPLYLNTE